MQDGVVGTLALICFVASGCDSTAHRSATDAGDAVSAEGGSSGPAPCVHDADCGRSFRCYFPIAAGCSAKGRCMSPPEAGCLTELNYCGCKGTTIASGCLEPVGYAPAPVSGMSPCGGGDASR